MRPDQLEANTQWNAWYLPCFEDSGINCGWRQNIVLDVHQLLTRAVDADLLDNLWAAACLRGVATADHIRRLREEIRREDPPWLIDSSDGDMAGFSHTGGRVLELCMRGHDWGDPDSTAHIEVIRLIDPDTNRCPVLGIAVAPVHHRNRRTVIWDFDADQRRERLRLIVDALDGAGSATTFDTAHGWRHDGDVASYLDTLRHDIGEFCLADPDASTDRTIHATGDSNLHSVGPTRIADLLHAVEAENRRGYRTVAHTLPETSMPQPLVDVTPGDEHVPLPVDTPVPLLDRRIFESHPDLARMLRYSRNRALSPEAMLALLIGHLIERVRPYGEHLSTLDRINARIWQQWTPRRIVVAGPIGWGRHVEAAAELFGRGAGWEPQHVGYVPAAPPHVLPGVWHIVARPPHPALTAAKPDRVAPKLGLLIYAGTHVGASIGSPEEAAFVAAFGRRRDWWQPVEHDERTRALWDAFQSYLDAVTDWIQREPGFSDEDTERIRAEVEAEQPGVFDIFNGGDDDGPDDDGGLSIGAAL